MVQRKQFPRAPSHWTSPTHPMGQWGQQITVRARLDYDVGKCAPPRLDQDISWSVSSALVAEVRSESDSVAVVQGKNAGTTFVHAWVTAGPATRDSVDFVVLPLTATVFKNQTLLFGQLLEP